MSVTIKHKSDLDEVELELIKLAENKRKKAISGGKVYLVNSGFGVGAALRTKKDYFSGHNHEFPKELGMESHTIHAEWAAIINMIDSDYTKFEKIAVVLEGDCSFPCGQCRDAIKLFSDGEAIVMGVDSRKIEEDDYHVQFASIEELLPEMSINLVEEALHEELIREARSRLDENYKCMIKLSRSFGDLFLGSDKKTEYFTLSSSSLADAISAADIQKGEGYLEAVVFLDDKLVNGSVRQRIFEYGTPETFVYALNNGMTRADTISDLLPFAPELEYQRF